MTREQLTAVIYRYAKHIGIAPEGAWVIHMDFTDIADVSDWAAEAMMYCVSKGIISGRPGGLLDPQGQATRAEVAAVLHRFAQTLE